MLKRFKQLGSTHLMAPSGCQDQALLDRFSAAPQPRMASKDSKPRRSVWIWKKHDFFLKKPNQEQEEKLDAGGNSGNTTEDDGAENSASSACMHVQEERNRNCFDSALNRWRALF